MSLVEEIRISLARHGSEVTAILISPHKLQELRSIPPFSYNPLDLTQAGWTFHGILLIEDHKTSAFSIES